MRVIRKAGWLLLIGTGLLWPQQGWGTFQGGILVYAWDSSSGLTPPPSTSAQLDTNSSQSFGTNNLIIFDGYFEAGTHVVEVSSGSRGYVPRPSPTDPDALSDPYSAYGNPRYVHISETTNLVPVSFQFDPVVTVSAVVRDAWTMERLADASIQFIFEGSTDKITITKYPSTATYASNWLSDASGNFPTNTILYLHNYDIRMTKPGYLPFIEANVISNAQPGDVIDLGTIFMEPIDNNTNQIADVWEAEFFGTNSTVTAEVDVDGDGISNLGEYITGTDPTNQPSCLRVETSLATNGLWLTWPTEPDHTYRVCGTTNPCADSWLQVGGPWTATNGQYEMVWAETNMDLSWNNAYRVEVVPCWWQGTNQVLINTNMPVFKGGTNTWGGDLDLPPIP